MANFHWIGTFAFKCLIDEIVHIRTNLTRVMNHDWVSVPLVYTQVRVIANLDPNFNTTGLRWF